MLVNIKKQVEKSVVREKSKTTRILEILIVQTFYATNYTAVLYLYLLTILHLFIIFFYSVYVPAHLFTKLQFFFRNVKYTEFLNSIKWNFPYYSVIRKPVNYGLWRMLMVP